MTAQTSGSPATVSIGADLTVGAIGPPGHGHGLKGR